MKKPKKEIKIISQKLVYLTATQSKVLIFIKAYKRKNGFPPTVREICNQFKWHSTYAAVGILKRLEKEGQIKRIKNTARGIKIL